MSRFEKSIAFLDADSVTEELMREVLTELEAREQDLYDQLRDCRAMGSEDGQIQTLRVLRCLKSTIRKCRKVLLEVIH